MSISGNYVPASTLRHMHGGCQSSTVLDLMFGHDGQPERTGHSSRIENRGTRSGFRAQRTFSNRLPWKVGLKPSWNFEGVEILSRALDRAQPSESTISRGAGGVRLELLHARLSPLQCRWSAVRVAFAAFAQKIRRMSPVCAHPTVCLVYRCCPI